MGYGLQHSATDPNDIYSRTPTLSSMPSKLASSFRNCAALTYLRTYVCTYLHVIPVPTRSAGCSFNSIQSIVLTLSRTVVLCAAYKVPQDSSRLKVSTNAYNSNLYSILKSHACKNLKSQTLRIYIRGAASAQFVLSLKNDS